LYAFSGPIEQALRNVCFFRADGTLQVFNLLGIMNIDSSREPAWSAYPWRMLQNTLDPNVLKELSSINTTITPELVEKTILSCPNDTSPGPDGIPYSIYKKLAKEVSVPLAKAFSDIQKSRRLPSSMQSSVVVCIPKKR
jgi:hypothetical protein